MAKEKIEYDTRLIRAVARKVRADAAYERAFVAYYQALEPLPDERFWELCLFFSRLVANRVKSSRNAVTSAADEFFRLTATGESEIRSGGYDGDHPPYDVRDAARFVVSYDVVSGKLHDALDDVVEDMSDDVYSDLTDALPLAGELFCKRCLAGKFPDDGVFRKHVQELPAFWSKFVLGEHLVGFHLREELQRRLVDAVCQTFGGKRLKKLSKSED